MIAAVGIGVYGDMEACAAEWVTPLLGEAEMPDEALSAVYDDLFPAYVEARTALRPVWRSMATSEDTAS